MKTNKVLCWSACIVLSVAAFAIFEIRIDGSILGRLWQAIRGHQVSYAGLRITLPNGWLALYPSNDLMLLHLAGDHTARIVLMTTLMNDPKRWAELKSSWIESRNAKFESEGYEVVATPAFSIADESPTCLSFAMKSNHAKREIVCAINDGHVLVVFSGRENDVESFVFAMTSVRPSKVQ